MGKETLDRDRKTYDVSILLQPALPTFHISPGLNCGKSNHSLEQRLYSKNVLLHNNALKSTYKFIYY